MKFKDTLYTKDDCINLKEFKDIKGMVVVLPAKEPFNPALQLWKVVGGIGTKYKNNSRTIVAEPLRGGSKIFFDRFIFMGVLKPELLNQLKLD